MKKFLIAGSILSFLLFMGLEGEGEPAPAEGYTHWIKVTKVDKAKKPSQRW